MTAAPAAPAQLDARAFGAVLFDFADTLFFNESHDDTVRSVGLPRAPELLDALARAAVLARDPAGMPADLQQLWQSRDLSGDGHRNAWLALLRLVGCDAEAATAVYGRANSPDSWFPYADTAATLRGLRQLGIPVAVVSNTGWDVRPAFTRCGLADLVDMFVLSYEVGVVKPDAAIFHAACEALGLAPRATLMVGDNPDTDGAATSVGCTFLDIGYPRAQDTLGRALKL